jgi:MFS family permease
VDRSFGPILPLYLQDAGMTAANVPFWSGIIFTLTAAAAAVGNQSSGWLIDRLAPGRLVPMAAAVAAVGAAIFGLAPPLVVMLFAAVVFGVAIGVATTAVYTAAGRSVSRAERGVAFGYLTRAYLVGLAVSPVVAGFIGSVSMRAVFLVDAAGLGFVGWFVRAQMSRPLLEPVARDL